MSASIDKIEMRVTVAWWVRPYLATLIVLCTIFTMLPDEERVAYWVGKGLRVVQLHRRPWPRRFINSYRGWRKYLGVLASLRAAWKISR